MTAYPVFDTPDLFDPLLFGGEGVLFDTPDLFDPLLFDPSVLTDASIAGSTSVALTVRTPSPLAFIGFGGGARIVGASTLTFTTAAEATTGALLGGVSTLTFTTSATVRGNALAGSASAVTFSASAALTGGALVSGAATITFFATAEPSGVVVVDEKRGKGGSSKWLLEYEAEAQDTDPAEPAVSVDTIREANKSRKKPAPAPIETPEPPAPPVAAANVTELFTKPPTPIRAKAVPLPTTEPDPEDLRRALGLPVDGKTYELELLLLLAA
jgi:hypothetical protein